MPKTVILVCGPNAIRQARWELVERRTRPRSAAIAIRAALERAEVAGEQVDHVVMGHVLQAGQGQIPSRQAQISAGIPKEVSSETINKVCASGIRAAGMIDASIRAGDIEVGVAGGMESMSNAPYLLKGARFGYRMGDGEAIDAMINDGLRNPFTGKLMALEASEVALELEMTRSDMDRWALRSHERAIRATDEGRLPDEIVPVTVDGRKAATIVEVDEAPRRDSTLEALAKLPPLYLENGTHTAGNSPGVNDGAGAHGAGERRVGPARTAGRRWRRIVAQAQIADEFPYLARTPAKASLAALARIGRTPQEVDLWEINEAFASVTLNSIRMLEIDEDAGQRQWRRGRVGPPDRRFRRADSRHAGARASPPRRRARLRGDLLGRRPG